MMRRLLLVTTWLVLIVARPVMAQVRDVFPFEDRALDAVTAPGLERFEDERAFVAYLDRVEAIKKRHGKRWASRPRPVRYAAQDQMPPCPPDQPDCQEQRSDAAGDVVVTGAKASAPSITNNQTVGVDEGDIVKQIGPYLLVLQDGRIFSVDTRGGLKLADRVDVYRNAKSDSWYDEMLVQGDRALVTAYSYEEEATGLSVFALDRETGRLRREGVFLITSDDYYDVDNYATRIVGDRLVIYTPYEPEQLRERGKRPVVRRWLPEAERDDEPRGGRPLFDARDLYRPVQRTAEPTIHTISVCPLGRRLARDDLRCRTTGFVAPGRAEMFVSPTDVFLWTWPDRDDVGYQDDCTTNARPMRRDVLPGAVFRLNVVTGRTGVAGVAGSPFDQFSMDSRDSEFRALVDWRPFRCDRPWQDPAEVAFLRVPLRLFGERFEQVIDSRITALPTPGKRTVENRFADDWLVYGGRNGWGTYPPDEEDGPQSARAVAVPVTTPDRAQVIDLPHNIVRTERVGNDIVLNGYRDGRGLDITLLALGSAPRIASTLRLDRRFESEGRSHAFNSVVGADGAGLMGLPTVRREAEAGSEVWRSDASDLSFVTLSPSRALQAAGELRVAGGKPDASYSCDVSCIDWYGNSRPIFTDGRVFGLMGTELVEARLDAKVGGGGQIAEVLRLDLTRPVGR